MKYLRVRHVADAIRFRFPGFSIEASLALVKVVDQARTDALKSGVAIDIPGFGKFTPVMAAARKGFNPKTHAPMTIPRRPRLKYLPDKDLMAAIPAPGTPMVGESDEPEILVPTGTL